MSAFQIIEEEQGTCTRSRHPHNGYFAGDFGVAGTPTTAPPRPVRVMRTASHPSESRRA